jgi:hypothetical protein
VAITTEMGQNQWAAIGYPHGNDGVLFSVLASGRGRAALFCRLETGTATDRRRCGGRLLVSRPRHDAQEAEAVGAGNRLAPAANLELLVDIDGVLSDSLNGDRQRARNLLV